MASALCARAVKAVPRLLLPTRSRSGRDGGEGVFHVHCDELLDLHLLLVPRLLALLLPQRPVSVHRIAALSHIDFGRLALHRRLGQSCPRIIFYAFVRWADR